MWSFVGSKDNKQWVWLAIDADSREIVGCFVGARSRQGAQELWQSLPAVYRQCALCYTDFWEAYEQVLPSKRPNRRWQRNRKNLLPNRDSTTPCGNESDV
jgi:IS1 family transposase